MFLLECKRKKSVDNFFPDGGSTSLSHTVHRLSFVGHRRCTPQSRDQRFFIKAWVTERESENGQKWVCCGLLVSEHALLLHDGINRIIVHCILTQSCICRKRLCQIELLIFYVPSTEPIWRNVYIFTNCNYPTMQHTAKANYLNVLL